MTPTPRTEKGGKGGLVALVLVAVGIFLLLRFVLPVVWRLVYYAVLAAIALGLAAFVLSRWRRR